MMCCPVRAGSYLLTGPRGAQCSRLSVTPAPLVSPVPRARGTLPRRPADPRLPRSHGPAPARSSGTRQPPALIRCWPLVASDLQGDRGGDGSLPPPGWSLLGTGQAAQPAVPEGSLGQAGGSSGAGSVRGGLQVVSGPGSNLFYVYTPRVNWALWLLFLQRYDLFIWTSATLKEQFSKCSVNLPAVTSFSLA